MADGVSKKFAVVNSLRGDKKAHKMSSFILRLIFKNVYARMLCLHVWSWGKYLVFVELRRDTRCPGS